MKDEMAKSEAFLKAPRYFTTLLANYICGMYFVINDDMQALAEEGNKEVADNILKSLKDPPQSSEQIVHPEKYWRKSQRDLPVVIDDADVEKLLAADGRFVVHKNTVGEILCAQLAEDADRPMNLVLASLPTYWTNDAATGWGGDRFYLLAEGKDKSTAAKELKGLKGVWITAWDTPDDREEFVDDYETERKLPSRRGFKLSPQVQVFTFGFQPKELAALEARFRADPPDMKTDGKWWPTQP
jgi:hypothetical protein